MKRIVTLAMLYLIGYSLWFVAGLIVLAVPNISKVFPNAPWYIALIAAIGFLLAVSLGKQVLILAKRMRSASRRTANVATSSPPVLYLRAFADDVKARATSDSGGMPIASLVTEEEQIRNAVACIGPLTAIGKPAEPLPELGANRMYVDGKQWKDKVISLIHSASLVVIRLASSAGLLWEVAETFRRRTPKSIVLLISMSKDEFEQLSGQLNAELSLRLPDWRTPPRHNFPLKAIITFDRHGNGTFLPINLPTVFRNRWEPITPVLRAALKPVCEANHLPWAPPRSVLWYSARTLAHILIFAVVLVVVVRACGTNAA